MECTESLFADIPTSDRMRVFWFSFPLIEMVMCRLIASTAISEQSSARISFFIRRAICRLLTIFGARRLFRSYCSLQPELKISEVLKFKTDQIWDHVTVDATYENPDFKPETALNQFVESLKLFLSEHLSILKKKEFKKIYPLFIDETVFRITITKGRKILAEYDLLQKKWLSQNQALSSDEWDNSLRYYRRKSGFELTKPDYKQGEIFIIGDTHFGHQKIIEYCARPFNPDNVPEMDRVLINNWNFTVSPGDKVIFLGDLKFGYKSKKPQYYLDKLNGNIQFIKGNHDDESLIPGMQETFELTYKDLKFWLCRNPS
jgi:hypothetical protein